MQTKRFKPLSPELLHRPENSQDRSQKKGDHRQQRLGQLNRLLPPHYADPNLEVGAVVHAREVLLRDGLPQEAAERAPALLDLVLQQIAGASRHQTPDVIVVLLEDALAVVGEVALEQSIEEHRGHDARPLEVGVEEAQERGEDRALLWEDGVRGASVPGVDVAVAQDDFGVGIGGYQLLGKGLRGRQP